MVNKAQIVKELAQVVDPEVGVPITEMDLVDDIVIDEGTGKVSIGFHLTAPFCPPMFALEIAQDIKKRVSGLEWSQGSEGFNDRSLHGRRNQQASKRCSRNARFFLTVYACLTFFGFQILAQVFVKRRLHDLQRQQGTFDSYGP